MRRLLFTETLRSPGSCDEWTILSADSPVGRVVDYGYRCIDLRLLLGGGLGRFLIETNFSQLAVLAGLQYNQEWVADGEPVDFNLESLFSAQFQTYRFDEPELEFSTTLNVVPELTPIGRVRVEYEIDLKWEIVKDFFWNLNFYDQFDSEPPTDAAAKNDWGVVLSFGVTF